ncbi:MAG: hypothetical protein WC455_12185 [Dehalococcoidia bacterium]|jgi:hypothetical protein
MKRLTLIIAILCLSSVAMGGAVTVEIDSSKWYDNFMAYGYTYGWPNSTGMIVRGDSAGTGENRVIIGTNYIHTALAPWTSITVDSFALRMMKDGVNNFSAGETLYVVAEWVTPGHSPATDTGITWFNYATGSAWTTAGGDFVGVVSDTTKFYGQNASGTDSFWTFTIRPNAAHPNAADFLNNFPYSTSDVLVFRMWGNATGTNPVEGNEYISFFTSESIGAYRPPSGTVWIHAEPIVPFSGTGRRRVAVIAGD